MLINTKQLAIHLLKSKVQYANEAFEQQIYEVILEFSRDAAKELFTTQPNKRFLVDRVDDVANIVDQNMQKNKVKMRKKISKKFGEKDVESTIAWLIDRWINTFVNLTTNNNYRDYFDLSSIVSFDDTYMFIDEENEDLVLDDIEKFSRDEIKISLKKVWFEAIFDSDFDLYDFTELCEKYNFTTYEILAYKVEEKIRIKLEINENQHQQMMFDFDKGEI